MDKGVNVDEEHISLKDRLLSLLSILSTVGGFLVPIVPAVAVYLTQNLSDLETALIFILSVVLGIWIARSIWRRISHRSYYYKRRDIVEKYDCRKCLIRYHITDDKLHYSRRYEIRSKKHGLSETLGKFLWTGKDSVRIPTGHEGIETVISEAGNRRIGTWTYYKQVFDFPLSKWKTHLNPHPFQLKWEPIADYKSSSAFVSFTTEVPTKQLTFDVRLGDKYADKICYLEVFRSMEGDIAISSERACFNDQGEITWTPKNMHLFRYYRIRWTWNLDENPPDLPVTSKSS